ncbi:hypothetical protein [Desulfatibacillum aliphaticivorans]|nr:hypothetical protein [Desulfatibacillum aliphaticivorans]
MSVTVSKIKDKPTMRDSGQGGLIGALVNAGRASGMREQLEGIKGETVRELLRQRLSEKMEEHYYIVDDEPQLAMEVKVSTWGWFVPSTMLGIKTGAYQCEIIGKVEIWDMTCKRKKKVAYVTAVSQKPLGDDPNKDFAQEALLLAVDDFAQKTAELLMAPSKK